MALSRKAKKIILIVAALVIALPLLALLIIILRLGPIVRWGVEYGGSRALGVKVTLQKADVSLLKEDVTLTGLNVANPPGFTSPSLAKLGSLHIAANVRALMRDEVHVRDITIEGPEFTIEAAGLNTNVTTVMGNLKKAGPASNAAATVPEEPSEPEPAPAPSEDKPKVPQTEYKLKIDHLLLTNVKVRWIGPQGEEMKDIQRIEISGLADANGNAIPISKVLQVVLGRVASEAGASALDKRLEKELEKLSPEQRKAAESLKGEAGKVIGNIFK